MRLPEPLLVEQANAFAQDIGSACGERLVVEKTDGDGRVSMDLNELSLGFEVDYIPREEVEFDGMVTDPEMARVLIGSYDLPDLAGD